MTLPERIPKYPCDAGDYCFGHTDPVKVVFYTMAGGGAHWWNYEVHYDVETGEQLEVYVNNIEGRSCQQNKRLFVWGCDYLRLEHWEFEHEDWVPLSF